MGERLEIPEMLAGTRLDRFVALVTGRPRSEVRDLIESGGVSVAATVALAGSRKLKVGETVEIDLALLGPPPAERLPAASSAVRFGVVYADEDLIVVDKPAGLVVHPGSGHFEGTLVSGLLDKFPDLASLAERSGLQGAQGSGEDRPPDRQRPGIVHRLDKDTSGLLVVARTPVALRSLTRQLADRSMQRRYAALACGALASTEGVIDAPVGRSRRDPTLMAVSAAGREARTRYEVRRRFESPIAATELSLRLETGRTHQIRVHLSAIGHPVVGDARYGGRRKGIDLARPFLHAAELGLRHPVSGEELHFESPLAPDLEEALRLFT